MPALTEVHFQNYRSFLDAKCRLSPVTVVIGANNAGKSNFLRGVRDFCQWFDTAAPPFDGKPVHHDSLAGRGFAVTMSAVDGEGAGAQLTCDLTDTRAHDIAHENRFWHGQPIEAAFYKLNSDCIGLAEDDPANPRVHEDGEGVTRVLKALHLKKSKGFAHVEAYLKSHIAEIEDLAFERQDKEKWFLSVMQKGMREPVPLSALSEGTRTILALLTILHQPNAPGLILIEDIERDIHPRSLKPLVETMRKISAEHGVQIIFTTQSPYVLDAFQDPQYWDHVVIVEKRDGVSTLTNAKERLVALGYEREMDKVPLGDLWYSGLLGGVAGPNELWDEEEPKPDAK